MTRLFLAVLVLAGVCAGEASATRIKDITSLQGVRENQLIGYGLVIGLQGTGDSLRNAPFTEQALQSMLDRMGINVLDSSLRIRNVAGVMVTANLPAFAGTGSRIDVDIASIGDAASLKGGTLLMTPLTGADGKVYAVAQGPVSAAGFSAGGASATLSQGVPTGGRIPNGALVEREVPISLDNDLMLIELANADYKTATNVADAINNYALARFGRLVARERDGRMIAISRPKEISPTRFLAEIGDLQVDPDVPARVVINERTGTVVIGQDVQISTVAMTHGTLTVRVTETADVSQPLPFSKGSTVVLPRTTIEATEPDAHIAYVGGASLQVLVDGLNRIGLKPTDIISILQAIKSAGALHAELIVQ
jgi:flagellar P-ring protein precursor FlgI